MSVPHFPSKKRARSHKEHEIHSTLVDCKQASSLIYQPPAWTAVAAGAAAQEGSAPPPVFQDSSAPPPVFQVSCPAPPASKPAPPSAAPKSSLPASSFGGSGQRLAPCPTGRPVRKLGNRSDRGELTLFAIATLDLTPVLRLGAFLGKVPFLIAVAAGIIGRILGLGALCSLVTLLPGRRCQRSEGFKGLRDLEAYAYPQLRQPNPPPPPVGQSLAKWPTSDHQPGYLEGGE